MNKFVPTTVPCLSTFQDNSGQTIFFQKRQTNENRVNLLILPPNSWPKLLFNCQFECRLLTLFCKLSHNCSVLTSVAFRSLFYTDLADVSTVTTFGSSPRTKRF